MESFLYTDCLLFSLEFLGELRRNMPDDCDVKKQLSQKITLYESHYTKYFIEPCEYSDQWFEIFKEPLLAEYENVLNTIIITIKNEYQWKRQLITRNGSLRDLDISLWRLSIVKRYLYSQFLRYAHAIHDHFLDRASELVTEATIYLEMLFCF